MKYYDLVIRGGMVVDGSGEKGREADIAVNGDKIAAIEPHIAGQGKEEIDARGLVVTPGFVDVHTHYDGQATWDSQMLPSSRHGVTTVVMGNCGVGFAPCRAEDHQALISLMEGVEDIPGSALAEGLPWNWVSFSEFLDALEARPRDIDVGALFPHGPLRVFVMGERAIAREPATEEDIASMRELLAAGLKAGAMGFSTSRTIAHRTSVGDYTPMYEAATREIKALGETLSAAPGAVFQMISDFDNPEDEFDILRHISRQAGVKSTFTLVQARNQPEFWKEQLGRIEQAQRDGLDINGQVISRPIGMLMGFDTSLNPFCARPTYRELAALPRSERVAQLSRPHIRARILAEDDHDPHLFISLFGQAFELMFPLEDPVDYMPGSEHSVDARASRKGVPPLEWLYEWFLQADGQSLVYLPLTNFPDRSEVIEQLLRHPNTVAALGDGGAHVGTICDASVTTFLLTKWVRDSQTISLEAGINMLTRQPAELYALHDRGLLKPGMKADINVIDLDRLSIKLPRMEYDLPAGGRRFLQDAEGYCATIVSGTVIQRNGESTGAQPGRLVRNNN